MKPETKKSLKESKDSDKYIFFPNELKSSITLTKIVQIIQNKSGLGYSTNYQIDPDELFTLQELGETIEADNSLIEFQKTRKAVNDAFRELLDFNNKGKVKSGYVYPVFYSDENGDYQMKILVVGPERDKDIPIAPLRTNLFKISIPYLEAIFNPIVNRENEAYYNQPEKFLLTILPGNEYILTPHGLSLTSFIKSKLISIFQPYDPLPILDFEIDLHRFLIDTNTAEFIYDDYYIVKRNVVLNSSGELVVPPELFHHFVSLLSTLDKVFRDKVIGILKFLADKESAEKIKEYQTKYTEPIQKNPYNETERAGDLLVFFPWLQDREGRLDQANKMVLMSFLEGLNLLRVFLEKLEKLKIDLNTLKIDKITENYLDHINQHFQEKKTLYVYDPSAPFSSFDEDLSHSEEVHDHIFGAVLNEFLYSENTTLEGKKYFYLLSPPYALEVVHHLAKAYFNNSSYKKQYLIAKDLWNQIKSNSDLDYKESIPGSEKLNRIREIEEIERAISIREKEAEFKNRFNQKVSIITFILGMMFTIGLYALTFNKFYFFFTILFSILISYAAGVLFANQSIEKQEEIIPIPSENALINQKVKLVEIAKKILNDKKRPIEERIYTSEKFKTLIRGVIPEIKKDFPPELSKVSNEDILSELSKLIKNFCIIIELPSKFSSIANEVYFSKDDIKDSEKKKKIFEHLIKKSEESKGKSEPEEAYYKHLVSIFKQDLERYLGSL